MFVTINQGLKIFLLLLVLPVFGNIVLAQSSQSANVATVVNKRVITLGEQIELTIAYRYPLTVLPSSFPGISDSFPHFEVVHRLKADTSISGEFRQVAQKFLITSFDSGHWTIPPFTLTVGNRSYKSDTIGIDVMTVELTGTQYHDIKEIIEVKAGD